jgi:hypothetical protein
MLTIRSGRSAARLARLVRDQEVGGSTPLAPTNLIAYAIRHMNRCGSHPNDRSRSADISGRTRLKAGIFAFAAACIAFGAASPLLMSGCTPAPKYLAGSGTRPLEDRETDSPCGRSPALGIRLYPPVKGFRLARITSPFGFRASDGRRHDGVDIKARPGEEILAAASGSVAFSGRMSGYGNVVILDHGNGISSLYAHLFYASVRKGESVGVGETIGRAGKRGRATGTHLHFEVRRNGAPIDPVPHLCLDSGRGYGS